MAGVLVSFLGFGYSLLICGSVFNAKDDILFEGGTYNGIEAKFRIKQVEANGSGIQKLLKLE